VDESQNGGGATPASHPGQGSTATPDPSQVLMDGKVPCSRCGQPSERGLCEACLDAIAELRQLSSQFGL
jgi:hypothetical protein